MPASDYFKAAVPTPCRVLGVALRPFCAGHIVLLHRIGSPFITGGSVTRGDVMDAVFICAHDYKSGIEALNDENTVAFFRKWRNELGEFDLKKKADEFAEYVKAGSEFNMVFSAKQQKTHVPITSIPSVQVIRCRLMSYYGMTQDEVMNMPWGLAQWDFYTAPVLEGSGDLVERESLESAQSWADAEFKRLNPQFFENANN